jgi:hypothetical protein
VCQLQIVSTEGFTPVSCVKTVPRPDLIHPAGVALERKSSFPILLITCTSVWSSWRPWSRRSYFVISRSPVRSRRVAPSIWSEINQLLTICKSTLRLNGLELAHKAAHRNLDAVGATGTKLLENIEMGQFRRASEFRTGE